MIVAVFRDGTEPGLQAVWHFRSRCSSGCDLHAFANDEAIRPFWVTAPLTALVSGASGRANVRLQQEQKMNNCPSNRLTAVKPPQMIRRDGDESNSVHSQC